MTRQVLHGLVEAGSAYLDPMARLDMGDRHMWLYPEGERGIRVEFEDKTPVDPRDRRAGIRLGRGALERLLRLPAGMVVVGIQASVDPVSFRIIVQSPDLPPVPADGCEAPPLSGTWSPEVYVAPDGVPYYRWAFQPTTQEDPIDVTPFTSARKQYLNTTQESGTDAETGR